MKRDIQGKFTLKNDDYREVRSVRLTNGTWRSLGLAAESLGMTRADLLEQLVRENDLTFPNRAAQKPPLSVSLFKLQEEIEALRTRVLHLSEDMPLKDEQILTNLHLKLTTLSANVLGELKLGKRSRDYKLVNKALRRLIELATTSTAFSK